MKPGLPSVKPWVIGLLGVFLTIPSSAQNVPQPGPPQGIACAYNTTPPTLTSGQAGWVQCGADGTLRPSGDGLQTYSATVTGLVPVSGAITVFEINGSSTRTTRIRRIALDGVATAAAGITVRFDKRSTASTGGTSSAALKIPHNTASAASTATVRSWTAEPTAGTTIGPIAIGRLSLSVPAGPAFPLVREWTIRNDQAPTLAAGGAESFALNFLGATIGAGTLINIEIEWTEE